MLRFNDDRTIMNSPIIQEEKMVKEETKREAKDEKKESNKGCCSGKPKGNK